MTSPLARRLLAIVAVLSIAVTGVATAVAFVFVQHSAADTQMRHLVEYVGERVETEDRLFSDLVKVHDAASQALIKRLESRDASDALSEFDRLYLDHGDGTRRTDPTLYDGGRTGPHYVYGIGGYRFGDFARLGFPLAIIMVVVAMIVIPLAWPLRCRYSARSWRAPAW